MSTAITEDIPVEHKYRTRRRVGFLISTLIISILIEWVGMTWWWEVDHAQKMLAIEVNHLPFEIPSSRMGSDIEYTLVWISASVGLDNYMKATIAMIKLMLVRIIVLALSSPIFILFMIVGVASGFALRDIRRWSGGREYSRTYHLAKNAAPKALMASWFVYIALPVSVHPNVILMPLAILFGLNMLVYAATFKKYW